MAAARPEPTTPGRGPDEVDNIIDTLNKHYDIRIPLPDKSLTPSRRRERATFDPEYGRFDGIYWGIYFLYYQRGGALDRALSAFRRRSKDASKKWVPKPRSDPDVLPSSANVYSARTPGERLELQNLLLGAIDKEKDDLKPARRAYPKTTSAGEDQPGGFAVVPARHAKAKRPSSEGLDGATKRAKGGQADGQTQVRDEPQQLFTAIDKVPVRQKIGMPGPSDPGTSAIALAGRSITAQRSHQVSLCSTSMNTSRISIAPSVFSNQDADEPPPTQSTVEMNPDERKRPAVLESSQDSLQPSSGVIHALHEAFSCYQDSDVVESVAPPSERRQSRDSPSLSTVYSGVSGMLDLSMPDAKPLSPKATTSEPKTLEHRLQSIWPAFPRWLHKAPLPVAWEVTRVALHCGVDLNDINMQYDPSWDDTKSVKSVRKSLYVHPAFCGKPFPEEPSASAWAASFGDYQSRDMVVVFSLSMDFNPAKVGPLFLLQMQPLQLDKGCRLSRHFGPDRFLEVVMPSPGSMRSPLNGEDTSSLIHWLTRTRHSIVGREWAAFFTSDAGYKTPPKELRVQPDAKPIFKDRVHLFAEEGVGFIPRSPDTVADPQTARTVMSVSTMLDWLLNFRRNKKQSYLKLFSRIKLGLSKTHRTVVFEGHQIHHRKHDLVSPIEKEMNDGVARMSLSVARKIRDTLGLDDIPSAIQGRLGSAKGMWVIDVTDDGFEDWIETYPSQRKWVCNKHEADHRALEVHSVASELTSAALNLQFLPVLEDRAFNKQRLREVLRDKLVRGLEEELGSQKAAMRGPLPFKSWVTENTSTRHLRVLHGQVPFLAGLPAKSEDAITFLLDGGFDPMKQRYIQDLAWKIQEKRCEYLKTKLNIGVGRSAYMYMVVDFLGVLGEGEVHVGFSTKFQADDFSGTLLYDTDVLVARSPAHFISDIQKVRVVFKPELQALRDVIVFSVKGNIPLAEKLSGGDYDGDKAWVCWDPEIVDNFVNADVPPDQDVSDYITRNKTTFGELGSRDGAIAEMIERSFKFNMRQSYLGICTNYKEKMCYQRNRVDDEASVVLSTLLSNLVDQAKQGILFGQDGWDRLCKERLGQRFSPPEPAYKRDAWPPGNSPPVHIVDWLKFTVAVPTINRELTALHQTMKPSITGAEITASGSNSDAAYWDRDLVKYYTNFEEMARTSGSRSSMSLLEGLKDAIAEVFTAWAKRVTIDKLKNGGEMSYAEKVAPVYQKWCDIRPVFKGRSQTGVDSKVVALLTEPYLSDPELSRWALLKASFAFKMYYMKSGEFIWRIAGRQLQFMKAMVSKGGLAEGGPIAVTTSMYAGLSPDKKFVRQFLATLEGGSSDYMGEDDEEDDT